MNSTYQKYTKISREFRDISGDLLRSDYNTFETSINFFKSFCNENEVIQEILQPILNNPFNSQEWYDNAINSQSSMVGSGDATLPLNKIDALKAIYDMLWSDNALNTLMNFGHSTMFTSKLDDQIRKVNDKITSFFVRYIIRELEEKIELVKPQSSENINNWHIYAPSNIASQSHNVRQDLRISNPELHQTIANLRTSIIESGLPRTDQSDALETVDMIEEEASKPNPNKNKIGKLLNLLPTAESISNVGANLMSFFG